MQHSLFQPANTSRSFNSTSNSDAILPTAPFQVPINLSADEIRELVRDVLG